MDDADTSKSIIFTSVLCCSQSINLSCYRYLLTHCLSVCLSARAPISFAFFWWLTGADGCSSLSALSFTTRDLHDGILVHADICDNVEVNPLLVQGVKQGVPGI